ncbi:MAG: rhodanese-like domain-containing protein [Bacillati bacterium ANGP1]|uniref:Rhodanese-like domain-containing protein n=1 Tax=Candidatus Segetimicrobium genomatis TaxID=2569760 RepID=A0A537KRK0_9BACT|nr:MAG: rhodanese-like domain-containing protein [Terrabacteria group bacterium ANGP1]
MGYDDLRGYLRDGLETARAAGLPIVGFPAISVQELNDRLRGREPPVVLDVRSDSEWTSGHIPGATHVEAGQVPLGALPFSPDQPVVAHCAVGARSTAAASVLARRGYRSCTLLKGGVREWASAGFRVEREKRSAGIGASSVL